MGVILGREPEQNGSQNDGEAWECAGGGIAAPNWEVTHGSEFQRASYGTDP
jgi:hypothetical protein